MADQELLVIKAVEHHLGPYVGVYPSKVLQGEPCLEEHIFDSLSERRRELIIGIRHNGVNM